jgi:hypothetical protein
VTNFAEQPRRHPDIFTGEEALAYLHLPVDMVDPADGARRLKTLEWLRAKHDLVGHRIGRSMMYHRNNLDGLVERIFGITPDLDDVPAVARSHQRAAGVVRRRRVGGSLKGALS